MGHPATDLAADERVSSKLSQAWLNTLRSCFNTFPQGNFDDVLATVAALHKAGVDILTGTDVSAPYPTSVASPTAPACITNCNCSSQLD